MVRKRTGRAALGAVAATLAIAGSMLAASGAQASTSATAEAAANGPTQSCSGTASYCYYDSGWMTYGDGACKVDTQLYWWPPQNFMDVWVNVQSPNLFASCTAYSTVHFGLTSGSSASSGSFWGFACAVLDPTCSDSQQTGYGDVSSGVPAGSVSSVDSITVSDTD